VPISILLEAVVAGARRGSPWVEVGVLIQRNLKARVRIAEDIATSAAVVTSREVIKGSLAGRVVANGGFWVGLDLMIY
jgi:hypothetical protein